MQAISVTVIDDDADYLCIIDSVLKEISSTLSQELRIITTTSYSSLPHADTDIFILDIMMPQDGFSIAESLMHHPKNRIAFITSKNDLVFKTFQYNPYAFIRKNHLKDDLFEMIQRYISENEKEILINKPGYTHRIQISRIWLIQAIGNNLLIAYDDQCITMKKSLRQLEREYPNLKKHGLIQINRSEMININYLKALDSKTITLMNDKKFLISRKYYADFKNRYYTTDYRQFI